MARESTRSRNTQPESETEDPIQQYGKQLLAYAKTHSKQLTVAAVILCTVLVAVAGMLYFLERAEDQASAMLIRVTEQYESLGENPDNAALSEVKQQYQNLIDEYGYTDAGKMALLQFAGLCYRTGDYDRALTLCKDAYAAFENNPHFSRLALNAMAYTHAAKGDAEAAITLFQRVVDGPSPALKPQALFQLGLLYNRTGKTEKSRQAYERLVSDFPDSVFAQPAKARLSG